MSELLDMLRVQARLHRKQGANALGQLFESAIEEIQLLNKTYNQLFDAFQDCQGELAKANERVEELECSVDKANEMLEEVRASGDLGLYMDNKLTAFLVGDSEQLRKEQE